MLEMTHDIVGIAWCAFPVGFPHYDSIFFRKHSLGRIPYSSAEERQQKRPCDHRVEEPQMSHIFRKCSRIYMRRTKVGLTWRRFATGQRRFAIPRTDDKGAEQRVKGGETANPAKKTQKNDGDEEETKVCRTKWAERISI